MLVLGFGQFQSKISIENLYKIDYILARILTRVEIDYILIRILTRVDIEFN